MKLSNLAKTQTLAGYIAGFLRDLNIVDVFALPGVHTAEICYEIELTRAIKVYCARHEQTCGYMAMGYSIIKGTLGVFISIPGPGILSASAAIASAHACNVPILGIVGLVASNAGKRDVDILHQVPYQLEMFMGMTRFQGILMADACYDQVFSEAIKASQLKRPGPVLIGVPYDQCSKSVLISGSLQPAFQQDRSLDEQSFLKISEAAQILKNAKSPLIIAGAGVSADVAVLRKVAQQLGCPIVASVNLIGRIPYDPEWVAHPMTLKQYLKETDVILAVGTRLADLFSLERSNIDARLIRIDICPRRIEVPWVPDLAILGKAEPVLLSICEHLACLPEKSKPEVVHVRNKELAQQLLTFKIHSEYAAALTEVLPEDVVITIDSTQFGYYWMYYWQPGPLGRVITTGYMGSLGSAIPLALGAKVAAPEKSVIAICGDGGFMMSLADLAITLDYSLPIVILLFDDAGYGEVRKLQKNRFPGLQVGTQLKNPDFEQMAKAYGARYSKAASVKEIKFLVSQAFKSDRLSIIHIMGDFNLDISALMR